MMALKESDQQNGIAMVSYNMLAIHGATGYKVPRESGTISVITSTCRIAYSFETTGTASRAL